VLRNECTNFSYDTIRYDARCHFNVRSKADISQLNLYRTELKTKKTKSGKKN